MNFQEQVENILTQVRPALIRDGGNIELVSADKTSGLVQVRLNGACVHCPMSSLTLKFGIEKALQIHVPDFKTLINLDQDEDEDE